MNPQSAIDLDSAGVLGGDDEVDLAQIQYPKGVIQTQPGCGTGKSLSLFFGVDDDLEFGFAGDVFDFDQFYESDARLIEGFDDEAPFGEVVDVFEVQLLEFNEGLIGLFEPVGHDPPVVVQAMDETQVIALERAQPDGWSLGHVPLFR